MNDKNGWSHFYQGLLNKVQGNDEIAEQELLKGVENVMDNPDRIIVMERLKADRLNMDYYNRFEKKIMSIQLEGFRRFLTSTNGSTSSKTRSKRFV